MTISSELTKLNTNLTNSYTAVSGKGGTIPQTQNFDNLADAISSIPSGTTPTGTLSITANGIYDVTNYASADVSVSSSGILLAVTNLVVSGDPRTFYLTLGNNNTWNHDLIISNSIEGVSFNYQYSYYTFVWNIEPNIDYTLFSSVDRNEIYFERERLINISENTFLSFNKAANAGGAGN